MANTQKTAIVTGASQGIGAGLVEAFLKRGYNVVGQTGNYLPGELEVGDEFSISLNNENHKIGWSQGLRK